MGFSVYCMEVKHGLVKKEGTIVKFVRLTKTCTGIGRMRDKTVIELEMNSVEDKMKEYST
jgi:hypothetical protein